MAEKRYWFKRKWYGWGWYPATWEGWFATGAWVALFVAGEVAYVNRLGEDSPWQLHAVFFGYVALITLALFSVCLRFGERPRWQWGPPREGADSEI